MSISSWWYYNDQSPMLANGPTCSSQSGNSRCSVLHTQNHQGTRWTHIHLFWSILGRICPVGPTYICFAYMDILLLPIHLKLLISGLTHFPHNSSLQEAVHYIYKWASCSMQIFSITSNHTDSLSCSTAGISASPLYQTSSRYHSLFTCHHRNPPFFPKQNLKTSLTITTFKLSKYIHKY